MPSVAEQILNRVQQALIAAGISGGEVDRGNEAAYGEDEMPAINVRRGTTETTSHATRLERNVLQFDIEHHVAGVAWETLADAQHMLTHAVIASDAQLAGMGHFLRCTGTEAIGGIADFAAGKLIAHYQIQFLTRPGDLTRAAT